MPSSKTPDKSKPRVSNLAAARKRSATATGKNASKRSRTLEKTAPAQNRLRSSKKPQKLLAVIAVIGGGVLLGLGILIGLIDGYGQNDRARPADAIVVLGAQVRPDGQAGKGLQMRVLHAVRLYKKGIAKKIITTGGVGDNPPAEAQVAADLAVKNGVPRADVVQENTSTSTWENATNATAICKKRGWKNVVVVSDPFHLWRAQRNFRKCGMNAAVSPAAAQQWQLQPARRLYWTAREAVLVARDWCLRRV